MVRGGQDSDTPLRTFLTASMLSTDTETEEAKEDRKVAVRYIYLLEFPSSSCLTSRRRCAIQKVTISTVHSAKGLEWPVVFIPAGKAILSLPFLDRVNSH
jgi:DNA helicase-2/ATP-dependent DNA helicase PcrA